jgi:hypothetical protein
MTKHIAISLTTDDVATVHEFVVGDSYKMLSDAVGGYIECVQIAHGIDMWVNEEGKILDLPYNATATAIFWTTYGFMSDMIFGDVIFTSCDDESGETTGLTVEQFDYLKEIAFDVVGIKVKSEVVS